MTLVAGFSLLLALMLFSGETRVQLQRLIVPIIGAYLISSVVLSPYLYYLLALGHPNGSIWPPGKFCADLVGLVVPRETIWWGSAGFATAITRHLSGNIWENGDYLGVVLIVFVEIFRRRFWSTPAGKFLTILFLSIIVAAIGPTLHIAGAPGFPMPWAVFQRLPLIEDILPVRFMMYAFLVVAVMIAMWFSASSARRMTKFATAAIIVASIAPNPHPSFWVSSLDIPAFFTNRKYATELQPREIILPLPWAQKGNSMDWQLESDMYFRMAGGWTGTSPFEFDRMPIVNYFFGETDLPEPGDQLKAYLARFDVRAIVADPSNGRLRAFQPALDALGVAPEQSGGALIYKIPPEKFAPYAKLTGAQVESRALALRFDAILAAAAKYIVGGNDPLKISRLELKRLNFLPSDWNVDPAPNLLNDWSIGGLAGGRIAIVLLGSPEGMRLLLDRYFGKVDESRFPGAIAMESAVVTVCGSARQTADGSRPPAARGRGPAACVVATSRNDDAIPGRGCPLMTSPDRARVRLRSLGAFALYFTIAVLLLDRGLIGHPDYFVGRDTDPPQTMWFFNWWRFSLAHGLNPFITDWVWAPLGINLAWTTFVPILAWVSIPLQVTVGEPATYNMIIMLALPLAAFSAFLLCRHVTGAFWPSVLGGYIFGFSSYMLGEVLTHLDLVAVFPVPLVALLTLKRLEGEITARRFAIQLAALLTLQFLCFPELFATITIVGGFSILLALALFDSDVRARLLGLIAPAAAGYAITAVVLSPYLYYLLANGFHHAQIWKPGEFSADLLAFVVPSETMMFGTMRAATAITRTFQGDIYENGAYLGLAVIVFVLVFRHRYWPEPVGKFLTILFAVLVIAALGPALHIAGRQGIALPWAIVDKLPLISIALPARFMMYAFLVVAVMAAMWFASSPANGGAKLAAAAIIVASIAPNPHASFWVSGLYVPAFFTEHTYATELAPREIILPLPWGNLGNSMYWQLQSDMYFRMAGGWTGASPFEFDRMPVNNYFYGGIDLPEAGDQLKAYIARFGVQAVIADPNEEILNPSSRLSIRSEWQEPMRRACGFTKSRATRSPTMPNFRPLRSRRAPTRCASTRSSKLRENTSPPEAISRSSPRSS